MKKRKNDGIPSLYKKLKAVDLDGAAIKQSETHTNKAWLNAIAQSFLCPISQVLMMDPVLAEDGYIYERKAIENWLLKHEQTSPLLRSKKINEKKLIPVPEMKKAIQVLIEEYGSTKEKKNCSADSRKKKESTNEKIEQASNTIDATTTNMKNAEQLYKKGSIREAAKFGYPKAQSRIAYWYFHGKHGMKKDYNKCREWANKAAEGGDRLGQSLLGFMYNYGLGPVEKDLEIAKQWYELAAKQGETAAMYNLARIYMENGGSKAMDLVTGSPVTPEKKGKELQQANNNELLS